MISMESIHREHLLIIFAWNMARRLGITRVKIIRKGNISRGHRWPGLWREIKLTGKTSRESGMASLEIFPRIMSRRSEVTRLDIIQLGNMSRRSGDESDEDNTVPKHVRID
jgi:hypothetical protein